MFRFRVVTALIAVAGMSGAMVATSAHAQSSFDWSGPYIGVNVGYGFGDTSWSNIVVPSDSGQNFAGEFSSSDFSGIVGGVQAGYNFQFGMAVAGIEAGVDLGDLSSSELCFGSYEDYSADCTTEVNWMVDLAARLGVAPINRALVYVKGGGSFADVDFAPKNLSLAGSGYRTSNDTRLGFLLGIGAEYAVSDNISLGAEYTYRYFGKESTDFRPSGTLTGINVPFSADTKLTVSTIMARLNYKF